MRSMIEHFQVLVGELALDPGRRVADVPWIGSAEDVLLADWENGPALIADDPDLVPQQILERIEDSADRLAVICGGERQDYSRFGKLAADIAQQLNAAGVIPGDRVAVFLDRSASMIAAAGRRPSGRRRLRAARSGVSNRAESIPVAATPLSRR